MTPVIHSLKSTAFHPWKWMVGVDEISFRDSLFQGRWLFVLGRLIQFTNLEKVFSWGGDIAIYNSVYLPWYSKDPSFWGRSRKDPRFWGRSGKDPKSAISGFSTKSWYISYVNENLAIYHTRRFFFVMVHDFICLLSWKKGSIYRKNMQNWSRSRNPTDMFFFFTFSLHSAHSAATFWCGVWVKSADILQSEATHVQISAAITLLNILG